MEINIDKDADAMYIKFSNAPFARNQVIDDETIIDIDSNNQIIGIELLDVSKRIPKNFLRSVKVKNISLEK